MEQLIQFIAFGFGLIFGLNLVLPNPLPFCQGTLTGYLIYLLIENEATCPSASDLVLYFYLHCLALLDIHDNTTQDLLNRIQGALFTLLRAYLGSHANYDQTIEIIGTLIVFGGALVARP